jgi:GAF domain-containing protein/HAMP domain-containing protein
MIRLPRALNFTQWPIWLRLASAFVVVVLLPTLVAFVLIEREVRAIDRENLTLYLTERGVDRRDSISDNFSQVRGEMQRFVDNNSLRGFLLRLMAFDSRVPDVIDALEGYMTQSMIGSGLFDSVRLMSLEGEVLLTSRIALLGEVVRVAEVGDNLADTPAHRAFQDALELGDSQRWAIVDAANPDETIQIEIVQVVSNADGPVGYVVGSMNEVATVFDLLQVNTVFVDTSSYLVTANNDVIAPPSVRDQAEQSAQFAPTAEALAQRTGTQAYTIDDQEYLAHYAPILDTPFAIITETPLQISFVQTLDRIYEEGLLITALFVFGAGFIALLVTRTFVPPLQSLRDDISALDDGDFLRPIETAERADEIGQLARTFADTREQIRSLVEDQASRITARVRDLQATQEVSRFAATQRDQQDLMDEVVELIVRSFPNIYHAQIFLIDSKREYAVLNASTGQAGQQLLARGHRLAVGSVSVIGQVSEEGRVVVARDTAGSEVHRQNEFLPETRAELAIPLRLGDEIIGALDVQSKLSGSFSEDQISILQTMADQIAIAIENTRLYQESVRRLAELELANQQAARRAWREYLNYQRQKVVRSAAGAADDEIPGGIYQQAVQTRQPAIGEPTEHDTIPFAIPILLRGQSLGAVEWELSVGEFSQDKVQLAQELVNRLSISLDNARLFQASQQATDRERLVNEITSKLTGQTDIEEILQTAIREVGQALRAPQVDINLQLHQQDNNGNSR